MSLKNLKEQIKQYGWVCQNVFGCEGDKVEFSYSIGFEETYDHPEVMIFGLRKEQRHNILNYISELLQDGYQIKVNALNDDIMGGNYQVMFKNLKPEHLLEYAGIGVDYFNRPIQVLVLFWPDRNNILPFDDGSEATEQFDALKLVY